MSKHTHCRWQLDKGSWISNDVKDENRCVWVLESDYFNMKESLEAENARLKAEVERLTQLNDTLALRYDAINSMLDGCVKEVEAIETETDAEVENLKRINTELLALSNRQASDIRRLTKAGDAMAHIHRFVGFPSYTLEWEAAKEGKQS